MNTRTITGALGTALLTLMASTTVLADTLDMIIDSAEATFGGEAYEAGRVGSFAEVQLLSGGQLIEALYDGESGALLDSESFGSQRLVQRVAGALDVAVISLTDAIAAAVGAVGSDDVLEAALVVSRRSAGRRYFVDIRTDNGIVDVIVDSQTGQIIRIIND